ncbi:3-isopropylmalate dehydratase small subunit [Candidatus Tachikawaea gelatinosa]|uniref:3-isopropylmalate dehydratase small subunit n=1 Tax=Candidatus Tachikawaea gelatinosa TaxID=1410383 RepID=A0A090AJ59_9ENTR|nr:3-isopropylmalate dehydratase small subunit [Candidatus Tachikawaea gelatinosa]BAP58473.1 3-isopropylmalate dehydratase small subunit [Candidatus Tachikawaea gelatinosa]
MNNKKITYTGTVVPFDISNIDTDIIIPKQFLKKITRCGFGDYLFYNWRYVANKNKIINDDFILNKPKYKKSSILLTRENFGCGSSREHAVWALIDFGFKVVIASSFSDIFYTNSLKNYLLPIKLTTEEINECFKILNNTKDVLTCIVNLKNQTLNFHNKIYNFTLDSFYLYCIINNIDEIDITLKDQEMIKKYEKNCFDFSLKKYLKY